MAKYIIDRQGFYLGQFDASIVHVPDDKADEFADMMDAGNEVGALLLTTSETLLANVASLNVYPFDVVTLD